jgi:hypothetical protein
MMIESDETGKLLNEGSWPSLNDAILTCTRKAEENREASVTINDFAQAVLGEVFVIFRRLLIAFLTLSPIIRSVYIYTVEANTFVDLDFPRSLQVMHGITPENRLLFYILRNFSTEPSTH